MGTNISRYSVKHGWQLVKTTREAVYTMAEMGPLYDSSKIRIAYFIVHIPLNDGYDRIKVFRKDLVKHDKI